MNVHHVLTSPPGWPGRRAVFLLLAAGLSMVMGSARGQAPTMRVESEVFEGDATEGVSRSLTLFDEDVAWDFLLPLADRDNAAAIEVVLHDPARERLVVIDPVRGLKTTIALLRLERLGVSLATWARRSDDRLICWAGGPDFSEGMRQELGVVSLVGPRVRYRVEHEPAREDSARRYREFADAAILLRSLLHPGGIPPFPRLAINRQVASAGGIPATVTLETDPRGSFAAGGIMGLGSRRLKSVHRVHAALLSEDRGRIAEAEELLATAKEVELAVYVKSDQPPAAQAETPGGGLATKEN